MDLTHVEFLSSSEEINKRPDEYWTLVMDIARKNNLKRILRCMRTHILRGQATQGPALYFPTQPNHTQQEIVCQGCPKKNCMNARVLMPRVDL